MGTAPQESGTFYTRSRKIPTLIGKDHKGNPLPGGPYTLSQAVAALTTGVLMAWQWDLWAHFTTLINLLVLMAAMVAALKLSAYLPGTRRNPLSVLAGILHALTRTTAGSYRGHPARFPGPGRRGPWRRQQSPQATITPPPGPVPDSLPGPATDPAPATGPGLPLPVGAPQHPVTSGSATPGPGHTAVSVSAVHRLL